MTLLVQKEVEAPMFGYRHWQEADYEKPLEFHLDGVDTRLYLAPEPFNRDKPRMVRLAMDLLFEILCDDPPERIIQSLRARGKATAYAAAWIHSLYVSTMSRFEALLRVYGGIRNLHDYRDRSLNAFFTTRWPDDSKRVKWSTDNNKFQVFDPVLSKGGRKINPLFKGKQVLTPLKWRKLQEHLGKKALPTEDIIAFHRIWARVYARDKRMPAIETAILLEALLKSYALQALEKRGFSKNKLKNISDDLSFNTCLNLVLPLTLSSSETRKVQDSIAKIDRLRRIRNDIVHDNLSEEDISEDEVKNGIDAGIKLLSFITRQRKSS